MTSLAKSATERKHQFVDYTPTERAYFRHELTAQCAKSLEVAAFATEDERCLALSDVFQRTAAKNNIAVAEDFNTQDGELYDGYVSLASAGHRFEPAYADKQSKQNVKKITASFDGFKLFVGEQKRFLTFTMPDLGLDCATTYRLLSDALSELKRHSAYIKKNIRAGYFNKELTYKTHWHWHSHALVVARWIDKPTIKREWFAALVKVAGDMGITIPKLTTPDGLPFLAVKKVQPYLQEGETDTEISEEKAMRYTTKYLAKAQDLIKLAPAELAEVSDVIRGKRLSEPFGAFNNRQGSKKKTDAGEDTLLAEKKTIDETPLPESGEKPKRESLVEYGARLIREGRRAQWLDELDFVMAERREFRKRQLAMRFPYARFRTLDGQTWSGMLAG